MIDVVGVLDGTAERINHCDDHKGVGAPPTVPDASPRASIVSAFGIIESAGEPLFLIGITSLLLL
jgi:hypothetical protein